ncbi:hypothetical protein [Deinococcus sp.]|uniref:hypothetical protein n=1 Tax=Deinococcus sp. TaxID=47478 RepID=UPI003B5B0040
MSVEIQVIQQDGSTGTATDRQRALLDAAQKVLQQDARFQALREPTLSRVEVNEGVTQTEQGHLYLRYDVPGQVPQEFWAHWGRANHVAWKSGTVMVRGAN